MAFDENGDGSPGGGRVLPGRRRLTWEELRLLAHELEAITRGGFPLVPALASLARDMKQSRLKGVLESLHADLERGETLDYALERQGHRFPPLMLALIRAGEAAGNLHGVLALMSTHAGNMCRLTRTIRTAMIYPTVLVLASVAILGYLLIWVVPPFQEAFSAFGLDPPAITWLFFQISAFLRAHGAAIAAGILAVALLAASVIRGTVRPASRRYWTSLLILMIPWYGRVYHDVLQTRFSRTLQLLLQSRVPVTDALVLSGAATGSGVAERAAEAASRDVAAGEGLADALRATGFFSHKFCWLLGAGEDRGGVEDALDHIAGNLEREVEASEALIGELLAPAITVLVGGMVGLFLIALYVPLYQSGKSLGVE